MSCLLVKLSHMTQNLACKHELLTPSETDSVKMSIKGISFEKNNKKNSRNNVVNLLYITLQTNLRRETRTCEELRLLLNISFSLPPARPDEKALSCRLWGFCDLFKRV